MNNISARQEKIIDIALKIQHYPRQSTNMPYGMLVDSMDKTLFEGSAET